MRTGGIAEDAVVDPLQPVVEPAQVDALQIDFGRGAEVHRIRIGGLTGRRVVASSGRVDPRSDQQPFAAPCHVALRLCPHRHMVLQRAAQEDVVPAFDGQDRDADRVVLVLVAERVPVRVASRVRHPVAIVRRAMAGRGRRARRSAACDRRDGQS